MKKRENKISSLITYLILMFLGCVITTISVIFITKLSTEPVEVFLFLLFFLIPAYFCAGSLIYIKISSFYKNKKDKRGK